MAVRALFLAFLLVSAFIPGLCEAKGDTEPDGAELINSGEVSVTDDDTWDAIDGTLFQAPGVETVYVFPQNPGKLVRAGEETDLLAGISNEAGADLKIIAIKSSIHLPYDHSMLVQNLTVQEYYNATIPDSAQATFLYTFAASKYLQPGSFDLVGTVLYEMNQHPYQSVFYNGTIEVTEAGGFFAGESIFLVALGAALIFLLGLWIYSQVQNLSKRTKRVHKVDAGTATRGDSMDEWLEGTAFAQSQKSKKKK